MMQCTLSRSTNSCVLVRACAGLPAVSCVCSSTSRPPSLLPRSFRKVRTPCSICRPPEASGPVLMVRKPIFIGPACATAAGTFSADVATLLASAPFRTVRRLRLMLFPPSGFLSGAHALASLRPVQPGKWARLFRRHDRQQQVGRPVRAEMQCGLPAENLLRPVDRIVMEERPAAGELVLEVRQLSAGAA